MDFNECEICRSKMTTATTSDGAKFMVTIPPNNDASHLFEIFGENITIDGFSRTPPDAKGLFGPSHHRSPPS